MDTRQSQAVTDNRIAHLETQYADQKSDIKELRNIVLGLFVAGVAAIGGLYVQIGSLSKDLIGVEVRLNNAITDLKHEQVLIRKDMKNLENNMNTMNTKLDTIVNSVKPRISNQD